MSTISFRLLYFAKYHLVCYNCFREVRYLKKGEETKNKILSTAKNFFYEKGYKKTSMKEIAETVGIAQGNLTYYFPTKDYLVSEIFNDYFLRIKDYAVKNIPKCRNAYYKHFYVSMIFNINIFGDPTTTSFYYETLKKQSVDFLMHSSVDLVYSDFVEIFNLPITKKQFKYLTAADYGARREVLLRYIEDDAKMPPKDLVVLILTNTSRLLGIRDVDLFRASYEAYRQIDRYSFSHIQLLK